MRVNEIMQKNVTTLGVEENLDIADDIMTLGRVRHLPVVDRAGVPVGLVTHRDLLKASVASVLNLGRSAEKDWLGSIPARLVMVKDLATIRPDAPISEAVDAMITRKIGCLLVVDSGTFVGLVTETDCLSYLRDLLKRQGREDSRV
jgi:CBS domain-containing membrane protein